MTSRELVPASDCRNADSLRYLLWMRRGSVFCAVRVKTKNWNASQALRKRGPFPTRRASLKSEATRARAGQHSACAHSVAIMLAVSLNFNSGVVWPFAFERGKKITLGEGVGRVARAPSEHRSPRSAQCDGLTSFSRDKPTRRAVGRGRHRRRCRKNKPVHQQHSPGVGDHRYVRARASCS